MAEQAILPGTGARAPRAILDVLQSVVFDVPSRDHVARVVIDREVVMENVLATDHAAPRRSHDLGGVRPSESGHPER